MCGCDDALLLPIRRNDAARRFLQLSDIFEVSTLALLLSSPALLSDGAGPAEPLMVISSDDDSSSSHFAINT